MTPLAPLGLGGGGLLPLLLPGLLDRRALMLGLLGKGPPTTGLLGAGPLALLGLLGKNALMLGLLGKGILTYGLLGAGPLAKIGLLGWGPAAVAAAPELALEPSSRQSVAPNPACQFSRSYWTRMLRKAMPPRMIPAPSGRQAATS